jgi:hypothetical protein
MRTVDRLTGVLNDAERRLRESDTIAPELPVLSATG